MFYRLPVMFRGMVSKVNALTIMWLLLVLVNATAVYAGEAPPHESDAGCTEDPQCPSPDEKKKCPNGDTDTPCSASPVEYATGVNKLSIAAFSAAYVEQCDARIQFMSALRMPDGAARDYDGPIGHNSMLTGTGVINCKCSIAPKMIQIGNTLVQGGFRYSIIIPGVGEIWWTRYLSILNSPYPPSPSSDNLTFEQQYWSWHLVASGYDVRGWPAKLSLSLAPRVRGIDHIIVKIGKWSETNELTLFVRRIPSPGVASGTGAPVKKIEALSLTAGYLLPSSNIAAGSQWTETIDGVTVVRKIKNTLRPTGTKRVGSTVYTRTVDTGSEEECFKLEYNYYGTGDRRGALDDLKLVTASVNTAGPGNTPVWVVDAKTFLTWSSGHNVRYVIGREGYARLARLSTPIVPEDVACTDGDQLSDFEGTIRDYADYFFEYGFKGQVATEVTGACSSCGGASLTGDQFDYTKTTVNGADPKEFNHWYTRTIVSHADHTSDTVFTNGRGMVLLKIHQDSITAGGNSWYSYTRYEVGRGLPVLRASSPTVMGYDQSTADLGLGTGSSFLSDNVGLVKTYEYDDNTAMLIKEKVQQGETGTPVTVTSYTYSSNTSSESDPDDNVTTRPVASVTTYPVAGGTGVVTSYAYEYQANTNIVSKMTTTLPKVLTAQNGGEANHTFVETFDSVGNSAWTKDERGRISYRKWDAIIDSMARKVVDVTSSGSPTPAVPTLPTGWTAPTDGAHLSTDFSYDGRGRLVQVLGPPVANAITAISATPGGGGADDVVSTAATVRPAQWTAYVNGATQDEQWSATGYETGGSTYTLINPVGVARMGKDGSVREQFVTTRSSTSGKLQSTDTLAGQSAWQAWSVMEYNGKGLRTGAKVYHVIPSSGTGVSGTNYNESTFGYDVMGRRVRMRSPGGTITRTVFDDEGRVSSTWVGTDDIPVDGDWSPLNTTDTDLVKVTENEYDGNAVGAGNLTKTTRYAGATDTRVTTYTYDWRNRRETTDGEEDVFAKVYYDNMNRVIKSERYNGSVSGTLLARSESSYDDRGRIYERKSYAIANNGTPGNALTSRYWYDAGGNVIKSIEGAAGKAFSKMNYDGLGRTLKAYVGYDNSETIGGSGSYGEASSLTGDTIVEQTQLTYDAAGNVIQSATLQRRHDATGTGALSAGSNPKARVSYSAAWFDPLSRRVASADYGTNSGGTLSRPSTVPDRSDTVLVSLAIFDDHGRASQMLDLKGILTKNEQDAADRTTKVIEAYDDGNPTTGSSDRDRVTQYAYTADGQVMTLTAKNGSSADQVTKYVYGSTASEGYPSSTLLRGVIYPDSDDTASSDGSPNVTLGNGTDSTFDRVELKYNRLGQVIERKDQAGTIHAYVYDKLGRLTNDRVPTFGTGVDTTIKRIQRTYTTRGQLEKVTSYDNENPGSGTEKNQVLLAYNDFGQLVADYQGLDGAVATSTTPKTQYAYDAGAGGSNQVRLNTVTYPISTRAITYGYGTSGGANDLLGRVESIKEGTATLQSATYLGGGSIVKLSDPQPGMELDYTSGTDYDRLDRFGRVLTHKWTLASGSTTVDEFGYGYDRDSNRVFKDHVNATSRDELYAYDTLNRLTGLDRGSLNTGNTAISGTPANEEDWTLDALGNWAGYQTKAGGTATLTQTRTHNAANEISGIGESGGSPVWVDPAQDKTGNMLTMPKPDAPTTTLTATYDAWNRMRSAAVGSQTYTYSYDGLGRRVRSLASPDDGSGRTYYYSGWRVLDEGKASNADVGTSYVWGLRYVDELVCQEAYETGTTVTDETFYAAQDANFDVTAMVAPPSGATAAAVDKRFGYAAYGQRTVLTASFGSTTDDGYYRVGHQGLLHDRGTGLVYNRARHLHPGLGRFTGRDPLEYWAGLNLIAYNGSDPINWEDPFGLQPQTPTTQLGSPPASGPTPPTTVPTGQVPGSLLPPNFCPAEAAGDCGVSHRQRPEDGGHAWLEINFGVPGYLPVGGGFWPNGWTPWTPRYKSQPIISHGNSGGIGPQTGWGDPLTGNAAWNPGNPKSNPGGPIITTLKRNANGTIKFGKAAGRSCAGATCRDIWDCIDKNVQPGTYGVFVNNCRDGAEDALSHCCLEYK